MHNNPVQINDASSRQAPKTPSAVREFDIAPPGNGPAEMNSHRQEIASKEILLNSLKNNSNYVIVFETILHFHQRLMKPEFNELPKLGSHNISLLE